MTSRFLMGSLHTTWIATITLVILVHGPDWDHDQLIHDCDPKGGWFVDSLIVC